jgi:hypothetical protein
MGDDAARDFIGNGGGANPPATRLIAVGTRAYVRATGESRSQS